MKLDTSSYYPKSPLDDDPDLNPHQDPPLPFADDEEENDYYEYYDDDDDDAIVVDTDMQETPEVPPTETEKFITSTAHFLSILFVPLMMPVYGVMLAFGLSLLAFTGFGTRLAFTAIVAGLNVGVPAIIVLLLKKAGLVQDVGLNGRKERFIPYLVCILCLVGTAIFMSHKGAPLWLVMFFYGGATAGLAEVIINQWWKISVHAAGIAGIVALLIHLSYGEYVAPQTQTWLLISIGCAGLLGSARLWLGRHTLGQVLAGYAVGFCAVFFTMMIH